MDDDGFAGVIAIVVVIALLVCGGFVIWIIYKLAEWCFEHPKEAQQIFVVTLLIVTSPVWVPPVALARLALFFVRDIVIMEWERINIDPRDMVAVWLSIVPLAALFVWLLCLGGLNQFLLTSHSARDYVALYDLLTVALLLGTYFHFYFNRPLKHFNTPIFIAAEEYMLFSTRIDLELKKANLRFWWAMQTASIRHLLTRGSGGDDALS